MQRIHRLSGQREREWQEFQEYVDADDCFMEYLGPFHQCRNLDGAFKVVGRVPASPVLLIDDVVDSRWTMTVLAALLRHSGSGLVYPVGLASASTGD